MSTCGCRKGAPVSQLCPEGQRLARRDSEAVRIRVERMQLDLEHPDHKAAKRRLQETRDDLMRHFMSEADAYATAERESLMGGA